MSLHGRNTGAVVSVDATEDITKRRLVTAGGKHEANKLAVGAAIYDQDDGKSASIQQYGIAEVVTGAAVAVGDLVKSDADGKVVPLAMVDYTPTTSALVGGGTVAELAAEINTALNIERGLIQAAINANKAEVGRICGRALQSAEGANEIIRIQLA